MLRTGLLLENSYRAQQIAGREWWEVTLLRRFGRVKINSQKVFILFAEEPLNSFLGFPSSGTYVSGT